MTGVVQPETAFFGRRPGVGVVLILAAFVVLYLATVSLPDNRYIRFQQLENSVVGRSRWDYERIHFDTTPIDVAVVGDSRTEAGVNAPVLETALTNAVGHPVHVANLCIPDTGRNLDFIVAKEVLMNRPELKIMLLALSEPSVTSQPAFKELADVPDVLDSPIYANYYFLEDVSALPYRRLKLFFFSLAPSLSGFTSSFDKHHYQGTGYNPSVSFVEPDGVFIDRDKFMSAPVLDELLSRKPKWRLTVGHRLFGMHENVIDDSFKQRIVNLAARRGVKVVLVHIPGWRERAPEFDMAQMAKVAPVISAPQNIADNPDNFTDLKHLSVRGIRVVSNWLPPALQPYLDPLRARPGSNSHRDEGITALRGASQ